MEKGYIHSMLDVKVLVLYIMNRVAYPVTMQKIFDEENAVQGSLL